MPLHLKIYTDWLVAKGSKFAVNYNRIFLCSYLLKPHQRLELLLSLIIALLRTARCGGFHSCEMKLFYDITMSRPNLLADIHERNLVIFNPSPPTPTLSMCCKLNECPCMWTEGNMSHLWTKGGFRGWDTLLPLEKVLWCFWPRWKRSMGTSSL